MLKDTPWGSYRSRFGVAWWRNRNFVEFCLAITFQPEPWLRVDLGIVGFGVGWR